MGRKKKVQEVDQQATVAPQPKVFEYGDLSVVCKCGRIQTLAKGIKDGLQLVITTNENSFIQLRCDECEADIKLCFLEGEKPVEEEVKETTNEHIQEESNTEQAL